MDRFLPRPLSFVDFAAGGGDRAPGAPVRTLTTLRWLAVAGQSSAVVATEFVLGYELPFGLCLAAIAASAGVNAFAAFAYDRRRRLAPGEAFAFLAWDVVQLAVLLFLTGGLKNPFALMMLAPATIAASVLPARQAAGIGMLAVASATVVAVVHLPLPWRPGETLDLPELYVFATWLAIALGIAFAASYAYEIAAGRERMREALSATEIVMAREQRLAALGGLAAAAAHELGTPLATIQTTAKEIQREAGSDLPIIAEDAALLVEQAKRCREILGRLSERGEAGDKMHDTVSAAQMVEEAAAPFLDGATSMRLDLAGAATADQLARRSEVIYGLRNFIENAVDFAAETVVVAAEADGETLVITIEDDGPGFAPEILPRLGEPYVTSRGKKARGAPSAGGLGLGFFIAKTLLERSGCEVRFGNRVSGRGARIDLRWRLEDLAATG